MTFRNDLSGMIRPNYGMMYNQSIGRPTTGLGRRRARETNDLLMAYANNVKEPEVRQALIQAIQQDAFSQMAPGEASRAILQMTEQSSAQLKNELRDKSAMELLAAEIPDLDPDLMERLGLDTSKPTGRRSDEIRAEALSRISRGQSGMEQQSMRDAEVYAARSGQAVSQQDIAAIRTRGAGLAARERGAELGDIRREEEGRRERNVSRLQEQLGGTTYEAGNYPQVANQSGMTIFDYVNKRQQNARSGTKNYGVSWKNPRLQRFASGGGF